MCASRRLYDTEGSSLSLTHPSRHGTFRARQHDSWGSVIRTIQAISDADVHAGNIYVTVVVDIVHQAEVRGV